MATLRVGGLVADHPRIGKRQAEVFARLQQQAGGGFAAVANVRVAGRESAGMMQAVAEAKEGNAGRGQGGDEFTLYVVVGLVAELTEREVGLIGNEDERIARAL